MKTKKPLVILEIANNHMGDVNHAINLIKTYYKIIKTFKNIDFALKFQFRDLDTYIHPSFKNSNHNQVRRFEETKLSDDEWKKILNYSRRKFKLICTAFDELSVNKILKLNFDYLKIASCSMNEWPLLEHIAKYAKRKKILCSLGGGNNNEIRNVISFFSNRNIDIKYLYCVAKYPTKPENLNLSYFSDLKDTYGDLISGFSTHELPDEKLSAGIAYSLGARIFEKHVGLKTQKYKLNKYSIDPKQFLEWMKNLEQTIKRYGSSKDRIAFLNEEKKNLNVFKRGAYLKNNLNKEKGETLSQKDLIFAFPSQKNQLLSNDVSKFNKIILKQAIKSNEPIFKNKIKITNTRSKIEKIRDRVLYLIRKSNVIIKKKSRIEISHHYGIDKFEKFGMCMITILNSKYCKKLLFIFNKQSHPAQYHKRKQETFFVLHGKVKLKIKRNKKSITRILHSGDLVTIIPKDIHSFSGISKDGCVIEELSTKSLKNDSYYIDKTINKNNFRKSYISLN